MDPASATTTTTTTTLLSISFLTLLLFLQVSAQPAPSGSDQNSSSYNTPAATTVIVVIGVVFLLTGFLSVFLRHFLHNCLTDGSRHHDGNYAGTVRRGGFDPDEIKSFFPTFHYADVKIHRRTAKGELECAVCLSEYEDHDTLRFLPGCCHVFHLTCIDPWLASRSTCPVCRADLHPVGPAQPHNTKVPPLELLLRCGIARHPDAARQQQEDDVESRVLPPHQQSQDEDRDLIARIRNSPDVIGRFIMTTQPGQEPRGLHRSHSTGHSIVLVRPVEDLERFTLRLPEPVWGCSNNSPISPGMQSPKRAYRADQASSVKGKNTTTSGAWWGPRFFMTPQAGIRGTYRAGSPDTYGGGRKDEYVASAMAGNSIKSTDKKQPPPEEAGERSFDRLFVPDQTL